MGLWFADYQPNRQTPVSSSDRKISGNILRANGKDFVKFSPPRALKTEEIPQIVNDFRLAARNVIKAGDCSSEIVNVAFSYCTRSA